jgi:hypothetical protein
MKNGNEDAHRSVSADAHQLFSSLRRSVSASLLAFELQMSKETQKPAAQKGA